MSVLAHAGAARSLSSRRVRLGAGVMITNIERQRLADGRRDKAARARAWVHRLTSAEDKERLIKYAAKLEAEASDLERQARAG
jgi:hypothetical protein